MIDQNYMEQVATINKMPINQKALELMVQQDEKILPHWIHAIQATRLAVDQNLVTIKNPQLQQALELMDEATDPNHIAKILDLMNIQQTNSLADLACQVLEALDLHLTETAEGYPNLQA